MVGFAATIVVGIVANRLRKWLRRRRHGQLMADLAEVMAKVKEEVEEEVKEEEEEEVARAPRRPNRPPPPPPRPWEPAFWATPSAPADPTTPPPLYAEVATPRPLATQRAELEGEGGATASGR